MDSWFILSVLLRVRRRWRREGKSIDGCVCLRCEEILVYLCMDGKAYVRLY